MKNFALARRNLMIERPYDLLALAIAHRDMTFNASKAMSLMVRGGTILHRATARKGPLCVHLQDVESNDGSCFGIDFWQNGSRLFQIASPGIGRFGVIYPFWIARQSAYAQNSFFLKNVCSRCGFTGLFRTKTFLSFLTKSERTDWNANPAIEFLLTLIECMAPEQTR